MAKRSGSEDIFETHCTPHKIPKREDDYSGVIVSTLCGGEWGHEDGPAEQARFHYPASLAMAADGAVLVACQESHRIRRVCLLSGMVETVAGGDHFGFKDGKGEDAAFNHPSCLAFNPQGQLIVCDTYNRAIRQMSADGTVSTLAGNGTIGHLDGIGHLAQFRYPQGLAVGDHGQIYVTDLHCVRMITPDGTVSTIAGSGEEEKGSFRDGPLLDARFNYPCGLALDGPDRLLVVDGQNHRIRLIADGHVTTLAGSGEMGWKDGPALTAQFNSPMKILKDSEGSNFFISECGNDTIRVLTSQGEVRTLAGGRRGLMDGPGTSAQFADPMGLAMEGSGALLVTDYSNHRIRRVVVPAFMRRRVLQTLSTDSPLGDFLPHLLTIIADYLH